jgi:hypothetical protein
MAIVVSFGATSFAACQDAPLQDPYVIAVLEFASGDLTTPVAAVGVLDSLDELRENSTDKRTAYAYLLDYNLGDSGAGVLDELITKAGVSIVPLLEMKRGQPPICASQWQSICDKKSMVARDARIDRLVSAINSGIVLCVDESDPSFCVPDSE